MVCQLSAIVCSKAPHSLVELKMMRVSISSPRKETTLKNNGMKWKRDLNFPKSLSDCLYEKIHYSLWLQAGTDYWVYVDCCVCIYIIFFLFFTLFFLDTTSKRIYVFNIIFISFFFVFYLKYIILLLLLLLLLFIFFLFTSKYLNNYQSTIYKLKFAYITIFNFRIFKIRTYITKIWRIHILQYDWFHNY